MPSSTQQKYNYPSIYHLKAISIDEQMSKLTVNRVEHAAVLTGVSRTQHSSKNVGQQLQLETSGGQQPLTEGAFSSSALHEVVQGVLVVVKDVRLS